MSDRLETLGTDGRARPQQRQKLSERLRVVLNTVHVEADGLTAAVGTHEVAASSPQALTAHLATALYRIIHVGRPERGPEGASTSLDRDLEMHLKEAVPHRYTTHDVPVLSTTAGGPIVELSGVHVRLAPHRLVRTDDDAQRAHVRISATRPMLSPGFFLVDGSLPLPVTSQVLRVYLHIETPHAAVEAWRRTLEFLEGRAVAYRAKAASSSAALPRRDGMVVYLNGLDQDVLDSLANAVEGIAGLGTGGSPFTEQVAPGVAVAWEPDDARPGMRNTSLGEHRSRALAAGLVGHATRPDGRPRTEWVRDALIEGGIDPSAPYRNLSSPVSPWN
ncbi:T3SS effector HopA1 family protein [Streptomyces sp. NBC_01185]|uniref:T3SS effector HopA1 family protein n=1 Tax=Streptomyces sp. NBC_01185 TaxID=2903764 RepID=UPI0038652BA7|nr:T3SS effector HopA1 family protein [Streptomyces sp. NBC_01185]